jgi:hypothetical protein
MKNLVLTAGELEPFKHRYHQWKQQGFSGSDAGIVPFCEQLNKHPGIAPVWSCTGHDFNPMEPDKKKDFYLMLAVMQSGWNDICDIYSVMRKTLLDAKEEAEVERRVFETTFTGLEMFHNPHRNVNPSNFMLTMATRAVPNAPARTYNAVIVTAKGTYDPLTRNNFMHEFLQLLKKL